MKTLSTQLNSSQGTDFIAQYSAALFAAVAVPAKQSFVLWITITSILQMAVRILRDVIYVSSLTTTITT